MTGVVYVYSSPAVARYALLRGGIGHWLKEAHIPALRTAMHGGYWLRSERVSDVMARMDRAGYLVRYIDGTAPPYVPPAPSAEGEAA